MAYQSRSQINADGVTLVEGIVAGLLFMILAGVMYMFFMMSNKLVSYGALNAKIQVQYETMVEQIGRTARLASAVLDSGEAWSANIHTASATAKSIRMFDANGNHIGGYQIDGTSLQEWVNGDWKNFRVGNGDVTVPAASAFTLADDRKSVTLDLAVASADRSIRDTAFSKHELFLCRN